MTIKKEVSEKELVMRLLRILIPSLQYQYLEVLYWVWKTPNYLEEWVNNGLSNSLPSSKSLEQRLMEKTNRRIVYTHPEGGTSKKKEHTVKQLKPEYKNLIDKAVAEFNKNGTFEINIEFKTLSNAV